MIEQAELTAYLKACLKSKKVWLAAFTLVAACVFFLLGSVHFVNGSDYHRSPIVDKLSFGFSETFINTDQIMGMPAIVVRAQFPLSLMALQRAGYLETDEQRTKRVDAENRATNARIEAETAAKRQASTALPATTVAVEPLAPISAIFDRRPIFLDASSLEAVGQAVGKHPYNLLEIETVTKVLEKSLEQSYSKLDGRMAGPASPIEREGNYYFGSACMPHNCTGNQGAIAIHAVTGAVVVGIEIESSMQIFGAEDIGKSPQQIRDWFLSARRLQIDNKLQ